MIAIPSEIRLESFAVLQSHYEYFPSKRKMKDPQIIFKTYEIDIDFAHQIKEDNTIQVFTKISVNQIEKPLPGYKLFVEGVAVFAFSEWEKLTEKEQNNLKFYSTVNIIIGYLRNSLTSLTSSSPMGTYLLPPINMGDLFQKKSNSK
jgi:preprotein translocase subunit SecB